MSTRAVVLLSGSGTTFENLAERSRKGELDVEFAAVVSSRASAGGLERARRRGVPARVVERRGHAEEAAFQDALHGAIDEYAPDLVLCAGFLSRFELRGRWEGRAMNIHPSLIPAFCGKGFYGDRVFRAVLDYGVKLTGVTVHFCDDQYDTGPIILQQAVPVEEDDDVERLRARVQAVERELYPRAVRLFTQGRLRLDGRRVRILSPR